MYPSPSPLLAFSLPWLIHRELCLHEQVARVGVLGLEGTLGAGLGNTRTFSEEEHPCSEEKTELTAYLSNALQDMVSYSTSLKS